MTRVIRITGATAADTIFTIDKPGLPELCWNVTRIQADAERGIFGEPERIPMRMLPAMTVHEFDNIDWPKVSEIAVTDEALNKPAIQIVFDHEGVLHRMPVDGNHRICARRILGLSNFTAYVVPERLEGRYRVTIETTEQEPPQ